MGQQKQKTADRTDSSAILRSAEEVDMSALDVAARSKRYAKFAHALGNTIKSLVNGKMCLRSTL
jgi:hypothetical protein